MIAEAIVWQRTHVDPFWYAVRDDDFTMWVFQCGDVWKWRVKHAGTRIDILDTAPTEESAKEAALRMRSELVRLTSWVR